MLEIGNLVTVKDPFDVDFPDQYEITEIVVHDDGQIVYILGENGGFDPKYVEAVE